MIWGLWKYHLTFGDIHLAIWRNTFRNFEKYIWKNFFDKSEVCSWPSIIPPLYLLRRSLFSLSMWRNIVRLDLFYTNVSQRTPLPFGKYASQLMPFLASLYETLIGRAWITPVKWKSKSNCEKTALAFVGEQRERCFKTECFWVGFASNINGRAIMFVGGSHSQYL